MGRAEQFFGIRTLAVLEARIERIRAVERPVSEVDLALPILKGPVPTCVALARCHDTSLPCNQKRRYGPGNRIQTWTHRLAPEFPSRRTLVNARCGVRCEWITTRSLISCGARCGRSKTARAETAPSPRS